MTEKKDNLTQSRSLVVYVLKNSHIKYVIQGTLKCISDKKD